MKNVRITGVILFVMLLIGCHKHPTKPVIVPFSSWTLVESFGTEPILGLSVNQDSTELHVMTTGVYGYLNNNSDAADFTLQALPDSISLDYGINC